MKFREALEGFKWIHWTKEEYRFSIEKCRIYPLTFEIWYLSEEIKYIRLAVYGPS